MTHLLVETTAALPLHAFHQSRGASFTSVHGPECVRSYSSFAVEYEALTRKVALADLSFRSRLCVLGADREKFLHGQITNDVLRLKVGQGCYAALVTSKGKIESDLFVHKLKDELLLDFEPGLSRRVADRLEKYVIAEDVQMVDVSPHYGHLSVTGPLAKEVLEPLFTLPETTLGWTLGTEAFQETYISNNPRFGIPGYDLFVPIESAETLASELERQGRAHGVQWAGFESLEVVRIENAVPRFGADMTENTLPQEAELQDRAISFAKGCYIGQEIIARIRTYGQVAKALRLLRLDGASGLPQMGERVFAEGKDAGFITSAAYSPKFGATVALAYIRKEFFAVGKKVQVGAPPGILAEIIATAGMGRS